MEESPHNKESYTSSDFFSKVRKHMSKLGQKFVYITLLMYYAYQREDTPRWAKNIIIGAISYFVAPIDGVPDLTPFLGFTDDLGVLSFGLVTISCYINGEVKENAHTQMSKYFKKIDATIIEEVHEMY